MYKRNATGWWKHWDFIFLDEISFITSALMTMIVTKGEMSECLSGNHRMFFTSLILSSIFVSITISSYHRIVTRDNFTELKESSKHVLFVGLIHICLLHILNVKRQINLKQYMFILMTALLIVYLERILWKTYVRAYLKNHKKERRVLLITSKKTVTNMIQHLEEHGIDFDIDGVVLTDQMEPCDDCVYSAQKEICGIPVVCQLDTVVEYVATHVIDEVFFHTDEGFSFPKELFEQLSTMGITTHMSLLGISEKEQESYVEKIAGIQVLTNTIRGPLAGQLFLKRILDLAGGMIGCILTGVVAIYVVPKIKKADPGPALFKQTRVGKNGRTFTMYKFRSMYLDAEEKKEELLLENEMDGVMFKMKDDPRILPGIGSFIRKTSIDEFPQFFNVLRGEMSLVGTRPPLPSEVSQYALEDLKRLAVKPGITGLWQVSGRSDITEFEEIVKLDSQYIKEWNVGMDIKILWKTIGVVFRLQGAR